MAPDAATAYKDTMRIEQAWAELHRAADVAAARGSLLFHLDLATVLAASAFATRGYAVSAMAALAGEDGYQVIAFDAGPDRTMLAEARFDRAGDVELSPPSRRPSPRAPLRADARETIARSYPDHAAVVIPADDRRAPIEGYALAVGDDPEAMLLADHRIVVLDPSGRTVRSDVSLPVTAGGGMLAVRQARDTPLVCDGAVPNELHTYLSLKHGVPLIVETLDSRVRWRVDGERTAVL